MAKPDACDTRQGLCVRCCGVCSPQICRSGQQLEKVVLVEMAWDGLPERVRAP